MDERGLGEPPGQVSLTNSFFRPYLTQSMVRYYIKPHRVVLIGKPSAAMVQRLEEEEKARISKQQEALGESGLKKAEEELEAAKKEHEKEIPTEILKSFPVPDVKSIVWIPVQSLQEVGSSTERKKTVDPTTNNSLARHIEADGSSLPFFVAYDHVKVSKLFFLTRRSTYS